MIKYIYVQLLICLVAVNVFAAGFSDAVHLKVSLKAYLTSDLDDVRQALVYRFCTLKGKSPYFLELIQDYLSEKAIKTDLSSENFKDKAILNKKNELEAIALVIKLFQVLVDQQVSVQESKTMEWKENCPGVEKKSSVMNAFNKVIYLEDLLSMKASLEKDTKKKQLALKSILESLDKQVKHEVLVDVQ